MSADDWTSLILLGLLLGALGQLVRSLMGIFKMKFRPRAQGTEAVQFSGQRLLISLVGGACAGALALITLDAAVIEVGAGSIPGDALMTIVAAGYAGTDFIEGLIRSKIPSP